MAIRWPAVVATMLVVGACGSTADPTAATTAQTTTTAPTSTAAPTTTSATGDADQRTCRALQEVEAQPRFPV
ncbi:hypothetical protein [Saccharothrix sp.]|uniref:hypothetical protein n=1 Tax=Saccharothrix sp. TaxID=1873460 RepID=UPI002811B569|nr:hypothetical protein [Saccharothrix sp.]